jgi:hypothetical protein
MKENTESLAAGVAVGVGSIATELLGVTPQLAFVAVVACMMGAVFAKPVGSSGLRHSIRVIAVFLFSVVLTCHLGAAAMVVIAHFYPWSVPSSHKLQAGLTICIGVLLHSLMTQVPALADGIVDRVVKRLRRIA